MLKTPSAATARSRLMAGLMVGPLFIGLSIVLGLASRDFDFTRHEVSLLLIGDLGWLQVANFILNGLLAVVSALGMRRVVRYGRGATWGPILIAAYGVLLVVASVFHPDPHHGFPANAPTGMVVPPTPNAGIHSLAFSLLALAIVANGVVFARRYWSTRRGWATYSVANSVVILVLVTVGSSLLVSGQGGLPLLGVAIAISSWVSLIALRTIRDLDEVSSPDVIATRVTT